MEKQKKKNNRTKVSWNTWSNGINVCRYCLKVISNRLEGNGRYCFVWDLDSTHSSYGISIQMLLLYLLQRETSQFYPSNCQSNIGNVEFVQVDWRTLWKCIDTVPTCEKGILATKKKTCEKGWFCEELPN